MTTETFNQENIEEIEEILRGRSIVSSVLLYDDFKFMVKAKLELDNFTILEIQPNVGSDEHPDGWFSIDTIIKEISFMDDVKLTVKYKDLAAEYTITGYINNEAHTLIKITGYIGDGEHGKGFQVKSYH